MNSLSNSIYTYYISHFAELPFDKQFHFASRLYLWSGDEQMSTILNTLRDQFTGSENPAAAVAHVLEVAKQSPVHGSKNAGELRQQYFERYPYLKQCVTVLFRITFMKVIYGIDARQLFDDIFPRNEVDAFVNELLADDDALAVLSTHAINFLYLYSRVIREDDTLFDPAQFLELGRTYYDHSNPIHLQLLIYLYTHCIIGEAQFYARQIPAKHLDTYLQMISDLEALLVKNYNLINLDNKYEFLVCCQMVGYKSDLLGRINDEGDQSVSEDGQFIIDRHNQNPQATNISLDSSEHRNVLCIMANTPLHQQH